nr:hypothetical protein [Tanacetum cinerariifolium]
GTQKVSQAVDDVSWVEAMNKKDERGIVVRNKARLVAQGHRQEEGIDYDEVFAPVARIEAIMIFLAFASYMGFIVYKMDVKSAFLYGTIENEVYVCQPSGFIDPQFPNKVYKVEKALYGLHQAPRAWYETLSTFLLQNGYIKGKIDKTLFIKKEKDDIMLVKQSEEGIFISQDKYVAEILKKFDFSSVKTASTPVKTQKPLVKDEEAADLDVYLYRSMIGSLMYLTASRPDIMFAVCAYSKFQVTPKLTHLHDVKRIFRYLKGQPKLGLWYPKDSPFDLEAYSDSDYPGANLDRKSITGGCQFLGRRLISWQCKKQTIVATSTTEAEYFWNTATSETVNSVKKIHAIVDGKVVVISESLTSKEGVNDIIIGNKMHKAFPVLVRKFPLPEGTSHYLKKNATARRKVMPLPEDCTAVIVKKKLSVKDDGFLKISAPCPALYSSSNRKCIIVRNTFNTHLTFTFYSKQDMDQKYPTVAKIPMLDTGKFEQWQFLMQQYLQHEHYALWETFTRLQVIVGQLQFMGVEVEQDDLNQKFLTSLDPEWLMHTIVWRNKSDLNTMSLDDLYNQLKVYEAEVQKKSEPNIQNMAFISSTIHSRGNDEVNTASVYTASSNVPTASVNVATANINQINEDDMEEMDIKWNMALLSMRADKFWKKTGKKISIQGSDVAGFDHSKVECFNCHQMGHFARECRALRNQNRGRRDTYRQGSKAKEQAPKALMTIDGVGWDWSYMVNEEEDHALVAKAPTEFTLMANTSTENKVFDNSLCSKDCKKNNDSLNSHRLPIRL